MLLITILIAIILLTVIVTIFFRKFLVIRINGRSMLPTYEHGQIRFVDRRFSPEYLSKLSGYELRKLTGRVFVVWSPSGLPIVKRLKNVTDDSIPAYWFEGDNPDESMDSRQYGYLFKEGFIGEVVGWREMAKRLFTKI